MCAEGACSAMSKSSTVVSWSRRRLPCPQAVVVHGSTKISGPVPIDKIQGSNIVGCRISTGSSRTPYTFAEFQLAMVLYFCSLMHFRLTNDTYNNGTTWLTIEGMQCSGLATRRRACYESLLRN